MIGYSQRDVGDVRETRPFLYRNGGMTDLNSLLPADSGWMLYDAYGINDSGTIVGVGLFQGVEQAFVLSAAAVPEPGAAGLLALGAAGALALRSRAPRRRQQIR